MAQRTGNQTNGEQEIARVTQEITGRLRARGISVSDADSPRDVVELLEGIEDFERAVELRGGDLMVDEPPPDQKGEPDDAHFRLPKRGANEKASKYIERLAEATTAVRHHRPHR